jgi:hypothetical protein
MIFSDKQIKKWRAGVGRINSNIPYIVTNWIPITALLILSLSVCTAQNGLAWDAPDPSDHVIQTNIYMQASPTPITVQTVDQPDNEWHQHLEPGTYYATFVDNVHIESAPSAAVLVQNQTPTPTPSQTQYDIHLVWAAVAGAISYEIYENDQHGGYNHIDSVTTNGTDSSPYVIVLPSPGQHSYIVRAKSCPLPQCEGPSSPESGVIVPAPTPTPTPSPTPTPIPTPPAAPSSLVASLVLH